jgi:hypothetical protein
VKDIFHFFLGSAPYFHALKDLISGLQPAACGPLATRHAEVFSLLIISLIN